MSQNASPGPIFYAGGLRLPAGLIEFAPPPLTAAQCIALAAELERNDVHSGDLSAADPLAHFFDLLSHAHQQLLSEAGFFIPERAELIEFEAEKPLVRAAVPGILFHPGLSDQLFRNLANGLARSAQQGATLGVWLARLRNQLAGRDRPSANSFNFLQSAFALGMPVIEWPLRQMQVGHGDNAAVLKGSITDATSSIGVALAKQKSRCQLALSQAGLPVAEGGQVADLAHARRAAQELGYPVAVKPADLDGGEGVACDVRTPEELDLAFEVARAASQNVIVERHIPGRDYRLLFYRDRLLKAIERFPGGVTGDGATSIGGLIEEFNRDPTRRHGRDAIRHPLDFDDEAELMLRRAGLTARSVPAAGEFVRLRRAANFSLGGTVQVIGEDEIHADNLDLCRRAMRVLRLDLAGLDLILPDIAHSWSEGGGVVCEVNAQPFIGATVKTNVYAEILRELVRGDGRIPLALMVGALTEAEVEALATRVPGLAVIDADGARLGGHRLSRPGMPWLHACRAALLDPQVAAALCILDPARDRAALSPVDRFSAAYLAPGGLAAKDAELPPYLATMLARAGGNLAACTEYGPALDRAGLQYRAFDAERLVDELAAALG